MAQTAQTPAQKGTPLIIGKAPVFTGYVVVDKTWKEKGNATPLDTDDSDSGTVNVSFSNGGFDAQCDIVPCKGAAGIDGADSPLIVQGQTLTEASAATPGVDARTWLIKEAPDNAYANGVPVKQSIKLFCKDSLVLA